VQPLHLHVEHRLGINLGAKSGLDVVSQPLLIRLLDGGPLLLELGIVGVFQKTLEFLEVLEPLRLGNLKSLGDEGRETRVALIEPATGSHCDRSLGVRDVAIDKIFTSVGNVSEFADSVELDKVLADCAPQEVRVELSDTVDLARAYNGQDSQFYGI